MKKLLFLLFMIPVFAPAQNRPQSLHQEKKAEFPGGDQALHRLMRDSLRYPRTLLDSGFHAVVYVKFRIAENGKVTEPVIVKSDIRSRRGEAKAPEKQRFYSEALRFVRSMPKWKPAYRDNKPVSSFHTEKINFALALPGDEVAPKEYTPMPAKDSIIDPGQPDLPFEYVEEPPRFPGGDTAMISFINRNIIYPPFARDNQIQGRVIVRFVVTKTGEITNVQALKPIPGLTEEAIRVVKLMPPWTPGKQNGKAVDVYMNIPIQFRLL